MLEALFGSITKEKVLLYILCRAEGYPREIAKFFGIPLNTVAKQLKKLETDNVLYAQLQGKTKIYRFNPRYPFLPELKDLLEKALTFYPQDLQKQLLYNRRRPRRSDKPL